MGHPQISLKEDSQRFFRESLLKMSRQQGFLLETDIITYLTKVLDAYTVPTPKSKKNGDELTYAPTTLMELYLKALEVRGQQQEILLKLLGEKCLYLGGFFYPFIAKKIIGTRYYEQMGQISYKKLSVSVNTEDTLVYQNLADNFSAFLKLFALLSEKLITMSQGDLVTIKKSL